MDITKPTALEIANKWWTDLSNYKQRDLAVKYGYQRPTQLGFTNILSIYRREVDPSLDN